MATITELPDFLLHPPLSTLRELSLVKIGVILWANGDDGTKPHEKVDKLEGFISLDLMEDLKLVAGNVHIEINRTLTNLNLKRENFLIMCRANVDKIIWTSARVFNFENLLPAFLEDKDIPMFEKYNAACNFCQEDKIKTFRVGVKDLELCAPESIGKNAMVQVWTAIVDGRPEVLKKVNIYWPEEGISLNEDAFQRACLENHPKATEYFWSKMNGLEKTHTFERVLETTYLRLDDYRDIPSSMLYLFGTEIVLGICKYHPAFVMALYSDWRYREIFPIVSKFFSPYLSSDNKDCVFIQICNQLINYPINMKCERFEFFLNDQTVFNHDVPDFLLYSKSLTDLAAIDSERYLSTFLSHIEMRRFQLPADWESYEKATKIMLETKKLQSLRRLLSISSLKTGLAIKIISLIRSERDEKCPEIEMKNVMNELISITRKRCNLLLF